MAGVALIYLIFLVVLIAGVWQAFVKAGAPGWAAIIPIYNLYIMVKMAGKDGWWVLLLFIPFVNFVVIFLVYIEISKNFGKSPWFSVGLVFLSFIFWPILGFGDAEWEAPPVYV